jgi:diguanylate cyclase (GGDEF)-like protein/PAS domain S-box-containing protein
MQTDDATTMDAGAAGVRLPAVVHPVQVSGQQADRADVGRGKPDGATGAVVVAVTSPIDRRLLVAFLREQGLDVAAADPSQLSAVARDTDLIIFDEAAAGRHAAALQALKQGVAPLFLPTLVLLPRGGDGAFWIRQGFEDILRLPLTKAELSVRVETFLRLRRQSQQALQESEARFRETFDQAPSGIAHTAPDGRFLLVNRRLCEILGYDEAELLQMRFSELICSDNRDPALPGQMPLAGEPPAGFRNEKRYLRKDGTPVWTEITVSLVRGAFGEPKHFISVINDISERKQLEEKLRKIGRARRVMAECNHVLVHAVEERALLQQMCEAVVAVGDYRSAWVGLATEGESRQIDVAACAGIDIRWLRELGANLRPDSLHARGPLATALRTRMPAVENDVLNAPHLAYCRKTTQMNGIRSALALPLQTEDECFGALMLYAAERDAFTQDEIELLLELAADIAYGMRALRIGVARSLAERELFLARERLGFLLSASPAVIYACAATPPHAPTFFSDNLHEQFGYRPQELLGDSALWRDCVHPDDLDRVLAGLSRVCEAGRHVHDYRIRRREGGHVWVQEELRLVTGADGGSREIVGYLIDIDDKKRAEHQLLHMAHYDDLTQLPNRVLFRDRLTQAVAQAQRNGWTIAVMLLDVDRFKMVNDTLGHAAGDELLRMVSARISRGIRTGDTVGRLGGDEFGVILADLARPEDAKLVADKILRAFGEPFQVRDRELYVSPSLGVTLYPADATEPEELIKNADAAMYRAKDMGRNNCQFYATEMRHRSLERLDMESSLRRALDRGEFILCYQPRVDVVTGKMVGMEALLRWRRPDGVMVAPGDFVPLLEETGLIIPVGDWVLQAACKQLKQWRADGLPLVPVAVNISARQLHDAALVTRVRGIVGGGDACGGMLELELTESSLMRNPEEVVRMLSEIRALGVRIAIDDFGTGYSSLSYLKRFPLDCLKIDQSFVRDITTDEDDGAIVRTIISIARQMNLKVVAEGVETAEQLAFLKALDCDEAQGYLFARPMPAGEIAHRLRALQIPEPRAT